MPTTIPGSGRWGDFERQQEERKKKEAEKAAQDEAKKLKREQADYAKNNLARPPEEEKYEIPAALARPPAEYQQPATPPREKRSFARALPYLVVGGGVLWYFLKKRNE